MRTRIALFLLLALIVLIYCFGWENPFLSFEADALNRLLALADSTEFWLGPSALPVWIQLRALKAVEFHPVMVRVLSTLMELGVALSVYALLRALLFRFHVSQQKRFAVFGTLLYVLLPIHASVVLVSIYFPLLMASACLFSALALWIHPSERAMNVRRVGACVLYAVALACHPVAILAAPFVALVGWCCWLNRSLRDYGALAVWVSLALGAWIQSWDALFPQGATHGVPWVLAPWTLVRYLQLSILPWGLSIEHGLTLGSVKLPALVISWVSLGVGLFLFLQHRRQGGPVSSRMRLFRWAAAFYFSFFLGQLLLFRDPVLDESRAFIPNFGLVVALTLGVSWLWEQIRRLELYRVGLRAAMAGACLVLAFGAAKRASALGNERQLWRDALAQNPQSMRAHRFLATAALKGEEFDEAQAHLEAILKEDPENSLALNDLGIVKLHPKNPKRKADEAAALFKKLTEREPRQVPIWQNYGLALEAKGELAQAKAAYEKMLELDPKSEEARARLAALAASGLLSQPNPKPGKVKASPSAPKATAKAPVPAPTPSPVPPPPAPVVVVTPTPTPSSSPSPVEHWREVLCESWGYVDKRCEFPGVIEEVQMISQESKDRPKGGHCSQGDTWTWTPEAITVYNGCRAKFRIRTRN